MEIGFAKYQVTGNDFIVINNFHTLAFIYHADIIRRLCHRQLGIGADGLITIEQAQGYDFSVTHYNADGNACKGLCGNGTRAAIHYAKYLGITGDQSFFSSIAGPHRGYWYNGSISLLFKDVELIQKLPTGYFVDNGNCHHIEIVDDVQAVDMQQLGFPRIKMAPFVEDGVNLNFVQLMQEYIVLRTCERGLEREPLSCGTGAVASALVVSRYYGWPSPIKVAMKGGSCWVTFKQLDNGQFRDIYLISPVVQSFLGMTTLQCCLSEPAYNQWILETYGDQQPTKKTTY